MKPLPKIDPAKGMIAQYTPAYSSIPDEYKHGYTVWNKLFNDWFFKGIQHLKLTPKDGVNKLEATTHIAAIMRSWELKHEHKEAAVAYLLSQWFEYASWQRKEGEG